MYFKPIFILLETLRAANEVEREIDYCVNLDIETIVTPIKVTKFNQLLLDAKFPEEDWKFLIQGFTEGFDIGYNGPKNRRSIADNIPFSTGVGDDIEMWNKIMKEVRLGRYAGPFMEIPYDYFIQSPIGLVPKDGGKKTQLIFHLSYDFGLGEELLNHYTPDKICTVKYKDLDYAVKLSLDMKNNIKDEVFQGLFYGKTDLSSTFRILPLSPGCYCFSVMKARDPKLKKMWYFIDKCLPFGSSRSCALFQKFSNALQFLTEYLAKKRRSVSNYLDDFLFIAATLEICNYLMETFLDLCMQINCPVSDEKTVWASQLIVFLGILLDGKNFLLMLPQDKCEKAKAMLQWMIGKKSATVKELQKLTGTLNFLTKAIFAGRTFTRRMYAKSSATTREGKRLKPYHHVRLDNEFKSDCQIWVNFLINAEEKKKILCRPYIDLYTFDSAKTKNFYSDAAKKSNGYGYGAFFDGHWIFGKWEHEFLAVHDPSIEYLELFAHGLKDYRTAE